MTLFFKIIAGVSVWVTICILIIVTFFPKKAYPDDE